MNKHLIFKIVSIWFLITQTFPPYDYFIHMKGVITIGLFIIVAVVLFPSLLSQKSIIALFLYSLAVYFVFLRGNAYYDSIARVIVPSLTILSALIITEYTFRYDVEFKYTKSILITVLVTNMIMILISIPQLAINPNIIRGASTFGVEGREEMVYYWIISYATIHGLPCLFAPLVLLCKKFYHQDKKKMIIYGFITFTLFYIVYKSNATTPLLLSVIMIFLGLFFNFKKFNLGNVLKIIILSAFIGMVLSASIMVPVLNTAQNFMDPSGSNYKKIEEIKDSFIYGDSDGDMEVRQNLYKQSKDLFFAEPFTGTSQSNLISMHTWILDQLACMGIILFSTFIFLAYYHVKRVFGSLNATRSMYLWSIVAMFAMLYLKNSFGSGTWLYGFAFLPLLCRYVDFIIINIDNKRV